MHWLIDQWATDGLKWAANHNCADFAEAVTKIAGLNIDPPKTAGINRPILWGKYLRQNGGVINTHGNDPCSSLGEPNERAIQGVNDCPKQLVSCFNQCPPTLSTEAAGACIRACGTCDAASARLSSAVNAWQPARVKHVSLKNVRLERVHS